MNGSRAESIRVMHPLFQAGQGGSIPTSALSLVISECRWEVAAGLNARWHSVLPVCDKGSMSRGMAKFYVAEHDGIAYAVAIWSSPVTQFQDDGKTIELRRLAISDDAPKNTASRMLAVMTRLLRRAFPDATRLISYQAVAVHAGTIYKAAGWFPTSLTKHSDWGTRKRRQPRSARQRANAVDGHVETPSTRRPPQVVSDKQRWEYYL